jgi:hypothetical protein
MTNGQEVFTGGGTKPRAPSELRSPVLQKVGAVVAESCVDRLYATWPGLVERYGQRGRRFTAEDNLWHLNFLDVAVTMDDPGHLEQYADWLVRFLGPRGLTPEHIAGAFGFLADGLAVAECPDDHEMHRQSLVDLLRLASEHVLASGAATGLSAPEGEAATGVTNVE